MSIRGPRPRSSVTGSRCIGHLPSTNGTVPKDLFSPSKKLTPLEWVQDLRRGNASLSLSLNRPTNGWLLSAIAPGPDKPTGPAAFSVLSVCLWRVLFAHMWHVVLLGGKICARPSFRPRLPHGYKIAKRRQSCHCMATLVGFILFCVLPHKPCQIRYYLYHHQE